MAKLFISKTTARLPISNHVKPIVFTMRKNYKIFSSIITLVTINMMYVFVNVEFSFKMLFHYKAMLVYLFSFANRNHDITSRIFSFTIIPSRMFTELISFFNRFAITLTRAIYLFTGFWLKIQVTSFAPFWFKVFIPRRYSLLKTKFNVFVFKFSSTFVTTKFRSSTPIVRSTPVTFPFVNNRHLIGV